MPEPASPPSEARSLRVSAAAVLAAQTALVMALYGRTLVPGFTSDAWVYLARLRIGVLPLVTTPTGYHYQPVACAWIALLRATMGESAVGFQVVHLAELVVLGTLTYHLGRRLLGDDRASFLASLLVLGSASFYEAAYWPLAGNMHVLAADLYVLAVVVAHDVGHGRWGGLGPWILAVVVLTAVFTHPAMVTAVPVCAVTLILSEPAPRAGRDRMRSVVRAMPRLAPLLAVLVPFGLSRVAFAANVESGPRPSLDLLRAYQLVERGLLTSFSLRGSDEAAHLLLRLGRNGPLASRWTWLCVGGWLLTAAAAAVFAARGSARAGVRALVVFLGLHVTILAIAGGMASREGHVPAVPAALLTAWALRRAAFRLSRVRSLARPSALLPPTAAALLFLGAWPDHTAAARLHAEASQTAVSLVRELESLEGPRARAVFIDVPAYISHEGLAAAVFANGLPQLVRLTAPAVPVVQVRRMAPAAPGVTPCEGPPISVPELRALLLDPSTIVFVFDPERSRVDRLAPDGLGGPPAAADHPIRSTTLAIRPAARPSP